MIDCYTDRMEELLSRLKGVIYIQIIQILRFTQDDG